jgi:uncharacterized protein with GYD domain
MISLDETKKTALLISILMRGFVRVVVMAALRFQSMSASFVTKPK